MAGGLRSSRSCTVRPGWVSAHRRAALSTRRSTTVSSDMRPPWLRSWQPSSGTEPGSRKDGSGTRTPAAAVRAAIRTWNTSTRSFASDVAVAARADPGGLVIVFGTLALASLSGFVIPTLLGAAFGFVGSVAALPLIFANAYLIGRGSGALMRRRERRREKARIRREIAAYIHATRRN